MDYTVKRLVTGPFEENSWYVVNPLKREGIFIDPGDDADDLTGLIEETDSTPKVILNTHGHIDHIGAVKKLQDRFGLPFYLHSSDEFLVNQYPQHAAVFGVKMQGIPEITGYLDDMLNGQSEVEFAGISIRIIPTPGHTPGGVCFKVGDELFAGDTLFDGSIGRTDLPGGDYETLMQSITGNLLELGDDVLVHSGHGPDTTIGRERESNPFIREWIRKHNNR